MKCKCGLDCYQYPDRLLCQKCDWNEMQELSKQYIKNLEDKHGTHRRYADRHSGRMDDEGLEIIDTQDKKGC